jgi:hypothetical protein
MPAFKMSYRISDDLQYMVDMQTFELFEREEYPFESKIYVWKPITSTISESNNWKYNFNNSIFSPNLKLYLDYDSKSKSYSIKRTLDSSLAKEIP